jgi:thiamine kinase-like enzyme
LLELSRILQDEEVLLEHPDILWYQPLTPVSAGKQAKVYRIACSEGTYILKRLENPYERIVMERVAKHGIPVPEILGFVQLGASCYVLYSDVGEQTLETSPSVLPIALQTLIRLHRSASVYRHKPERTAVGDGIKITDSFLERQQTIREMAQTDWDTVFQLWCSHAGDRSLLERSITDSLHMHPVTGWYVFSHGDYHPNNIAVLDRSRCVVLDWEHAGYQPVYTDLYALLDMCYPDALTCRYHYNRVKMLRTYANALELDWGPFYRNYLAFCLVNHVREVVCCYRDLQVRIRDVVSLTWQVKWIFHELAQVQGELA